MSNKVLKLVRKVIVCLSLCFLASCASKEEKIEIDYNTYFFDIVQADESNIYSSTQEVIGKVMQGRIKVKKDDAFENGYFNILNTEYYVKYDEVFEADLNMVYEAYTPFGIKIKTNEMYTMHKADLSIEMNTANEYEVYRKTEDSVYVYFNDQFVRISNNDIDSFVTYDTNIEYANDLPVLMYHFFYDPNVSSKKDANWLNIETFKQQLDYLVENNYAVLTMKQVNEYMDQEIKIPENSVAITIDDGDPSVEALAYNEMYQRSIPASLYLITSYYGDWLPENFRNMRQWGQMDLQSHSHDMHRGGGCNKGRGGRLLCVDYETALADVLKSQEVINDAFVFVYPFGDFDENAMKVLEDANYKLAFTTKNGRIKPGMNKLMLPRIRISDGLSMDSFQVLVK